MCLVLGFSTNPFENMTDEEMTTTLNPGQSLEFKHRILLSSGNFISDDEMNKQSGDFNK